jgi:hypothetical protein
MMGVVVLCTELIADLTTGPASRMHVGVRVPGPDRPEEFRERGWLSRIDALAGRPDDVGRLDDSFDLAVR